MEDARTDQRNGPPRVLLLAGAVIVLAGMRQASTVIAPAFTALLVAIAFVPLQRALGQRIGRVAGFIVTLLVVLLIIASLVALAGFGIAGLAQALPRYAGATDDVSQQANALLVPTGLDATAIIETLERQFADNREMAVNTIGAAAKGIADFGVVVLLAAFMLADAVKLNEKTAVLGKLSAEWVGRIERTIKEIRTYLKVMGAMGLMIGGISTVVFLLLGIELAVLWGVFIFVGAFVPYIGLWAALAPPVLLATLDKGLYVGAALLLGILIVNGIASNVIKPKLLADGLNLSPFTVIFSVVFWAYIFGPLGAVLSIPLTLAVKELVFDVDPGMSWLSTLMGHRLDEDEAVASALDAQKQPDQDRR